VIYTVDIDSDEPIMLINKHIGFDTIDGQGIDGSSFQSELLYLDTLGKKRIQVWINSTGGSVFDGYSIFSAILKSKTPVDTYNIGIAASIAGVIFQAGRKRYISDYAWFMMHKANGSNDSQMLEIVDSSLVKMLTSKSGISEQDVIGMMERTTYLDAKTCVAMGFSDAIEITKNLNTKYIRTDVKQDVFAFQKECSLIVNSIDKLKKEDMLKIKNKLNLAENTSEDDVLKAIEVIENKAKDLETKNKVSEEKVVELQCEIDDKIKELDTMKAELNAEKEAKNKAELSEKTEKAKTLVAEYVKVGKIENKEELVTKWVNKAVENFDDTKELLDSIQLNKKAPEFENKDVVKPYNMAAKMAEINNKQEIK